jgi:acyl-CoA thioesterase-1
VQPDEGTIVAMGNSLTAGLGVAEERAYPAQLETLLRSNGYRFRVVNAGISGETSSGALSRTQWTLTLQPDIVVLETGANDGLRGVSPDVIQQNINAIVQQLQQHNVVVILAGMRMVENLGDVYTRAFANVYQAVSQTPGLIFMPFFLDGVGGNPDLNQADGIHPTADGYRHIVVALYPYVQTAIEQMRRNRRASP